MPMPPVSPLPPPEAKPRLFIREMVMRNFKSYAGEQRVGPFHKSFTAVVGPNGSGKSNVIDAMLFVFGKRAKQMRLNKVSELIHNSTNHRDLDRAEVSVHFQEIVDLDDGGYEVVKGSEFAITRVALRDNSSRYYINDRGSNFTEVTKKLKEKGVDLDNNRFLILQGEVEQISLMKPKAQGPHDEGFLEYMEDIIGTNQYIEKIDEAYKQVESLNEKRSGVVQMVKLAEKERDSLEEVKNEAETYLLKELILLKWQEKATKLALDTSNCQILDLQKNISELEENVKKERESFKEKSKNLDNLEAEYNKYLKRQEELDNELRLCKEQFKEFERHDVKHEEDLKHLKKKIKKIEDKIDKESTKVEEIHKDREKASALVPKLEVEIPKLQHLLMNEETILDSIKERSKDETERLLSELSGVRSELEPWEKQLIDHKGKLDVACTERTILEERLNACRQAFSKAKNDLSDLTDKIKGKNAILTKIQNDLIKHKCEADQARKLEQEMSSLQEALIPSEQAARQKLTELVSVLESEKNQGSVLRAILKAKEDKEIDGIYGRLGDLGAIDAKYDIAISTACSGLDYIVVETTAAAQACVELLRRNNLGIGTFMILEKQIDYLNKMKEKVKTPEGVPRLFDLITVNNDRLKLAFYSALRNTVVAKDLEQATRIAYGRDSEFRRVVTLEGALFEKSGTMSGGGDKPRGGKMGTSIRVGVSADVVASAEKELNVLVDQLNDYRQRIADARFCYQSAEKVICKLEMDLAKSQKEIDNFNSQYQYTEKQLDSLKIAAEPKEEDIHILEELGNVVNEEQLEVERLTKISGKLKQKASQLQKQIDNAGGEELKNQQMNVLKIQSDIDKNLTEINRCKVLIVTNEKLDKKLAKSIEESKREKEKLLSEKDNMDVSFMDVKKKASAVKESYMKTQELIDNHKDVLDESREEYNKLKKMIDELRATEVDTGFKLNDLKKFLKEHDLNRKGLEKRLSDLLKNLTEHMKQIEKDAVDPDKLQTSLSDASLNETCDLRKASEMVTLIEAQLKEMNPNLDSISEYRKKSALYSERVEELNLVTQDRDQLKKQYDDLRKRRLDEFMAGFNIISLKLKEMYQMITLGGDAELELVDSLDPFSEGVVFSVRPPKKSWKNIANLSGGEKTLSSLALVFALHHYKPTPLYVMDEIDAALDFKNVSIVGHYVKERTKDAQFVIISLRNNMFELADRLVGIYKTDNCTKSITIDPGTFAHQGGVLKGCTTASSGN